MKVILAIDLSNGSQHVVNEAAARPWPTGSKLCVVSIVDMAHWAGLPMLIEDAKHAAQSVADAAMGRLEFPGREVFSEVQLGFPKKAIPALARDWGADLVMVGSRGQGALSRLLLGSVAQAVLRSAPCSVEIVRHTASDPPASSRALKILLTTDGSECSEIATLSVANRPWPPGTEIKIISVRDLLVLENQTTAASPCPVYPETLLTEMLDDARNRAKEAVVKAQETLTSKGLTICNSQAFPLAIPERVYWMKQVRGALT